MNASDQIIKVLDAVCEKLGVAADWTSDNVIPYAEDLYRRFIMYTVAKTITSMIVAVIIFIICVALLKKVKKNRSSIEENAGAGAFWTVYLVIIFFICVTAEYFFSMSDTLIECFTIPEKVVFDLAQSMLNPNVS